MDLHGKPLIITFWATSCPSCVKEIPHLIALYEQYHPQGIEIIAIAMTYDPPNRVVSMTQEKKLPYHVVLDIKGGIWRKLSVTFGQRRQPYLLTETAK